ncbi:MAG TPA: hypothetical protein VGX23_05520 [Actinocrinis sp.]|nr:hypothetical protein [Actinocrinis sp.]
MIGAALEDLLGRARGPLGPPIDLDLGLESGPLAELGELLSRLNGFALFNAGVQVFQAGGQGPGPELMAWNTDTTWKNTYGTLADDVFCFGQDLFGVQFGIVANAQVVTFNPETAERIALGPGLADWAAWLLADPDVNGAATFARSYQDQHGPLAPGQRLIPLRYFVGGGEYDFDNLVVRDAAQAMRIRGPIARQVHDLPDGAVIRLSASE